MSDKTTYTVEVYDPEWNYGGDPEDNWRHSCQEAFDTFSQAENAAKTVTGTYRSVRIKKHVWSEVALYQDGVVVE